MKIRTFAPSFWLLPVLFTLLSLAAHSQASTPLAAQPENTVQPVHHIVLVWLEDSSDRTLQKTIDATWALANIPGVSQLKVARAIASERAIVDDSFSFGITMRFADTDSMTQYLAHPGHQAYLQSQIKGKVSRVQVYDF